jgi:hypothetical protein
MQTNRATIDSSDPDLDASLLGDGKLETAARLSIPAVGDKAWIRYSFSHPTTIRAITLATTDQLSLVTWLYNLPSPHIEFEASDDGNVWTKVATLPSHGCPRLRSPFLQPRREIFASRFVTIPLAE